MNDLPCPVTFDQISDALIAGQFRAFDATEYDMYAGVNGVGYSWSPNPDDENGCTVILDRSPHGLNFQVIQGDHFWDVNLCDATIEQLN